jgi:protein O-mannosyl-transferase
MAVTKTKDTIAKKYEKQKAFKPELIHSGQNRQNRIFILIALIVTLLVYAGSLKNGLIKNWDDGGYIVEHTLIRKLNVENVKQIFSVFYKGNYHPLTTLTYALEYSIVGEKPFLYHLNNLALHLLNVLLVFVFIRKLTKKSEIAFITALLFGIHPMHVESVAWISERKDVLYTFFFLGSMLYYMKYREVKEKKAKYLMFSILALLLSLLSKSAAVTLPVVLLLIDYLQKRKWEWMVLIEKLPFFILSFGFGIAAIYSQKSAGAIQDLNPLFTIGERLMLASYATMMYIVKLFVPVNLSAMYPYPDRIAGSLPLIYKIAPAVITIFVALVIISKKYTREIIFGVLFFIVTIFLVLQLLPVGGAILAERYTYVPYIGLFMIIGKAYVWMNENKKRIFKTLKPLYVVIIALFVVVFSYQSFERIKLWKNGEILFTDMIRIYPNLPFAYNNRGYLYFNFIKNYDKALADYSKCLQLDSTFHRAYSNRGVLYYNMAENGKKDGSITKATTLDSLYHLAVKDFDHAIKFKPDNTDAWIGRANTYSTLKNFDLALKDYNKYIELDPANAKAYLWRGTALCNLLHYNEALTDFNKCLVMTPKDDNAYYWRGIAYYKLNDFKASIKDLTTSLELNPKQSEPYSWRGLAYYDLKLFDESIADYNKAIELNPRDAAAYVNRSLSYYELKNYRQAFKDLCSAGDMGFPLSKDYFMKLQALSGK